MPDSITLYTAKICPYAHRVELALAEAKADFKRFDVDLKNKPEWYAPKVNPASKVPAIAYGGPDVPPDQPSPESIKIAESLVLIEFVADLFPSANLLPTDPVLRAKARFFYDAVGNKFNSAYFNYVLKPGGSQEALFKATEDLQALLPPTGFAVGEWSIADAAWTPFIARLFVALENDLGGYTVGEGPKSLQVLLNDTRFARFQQYWKDVSARTSFTSTFDKQLIKEGLSKRFADIQRA
ncbi:hypothetical protein QCA50_011909 [Cerrena zonata]|uniref:GST N-terminal domain-containing protein n=1 Tax=Cerrena zonata TaxID=2478898 RepID=A0AAW0FY04_9APHY